MNRRVGEYYLKEVIKDAQCFIVHKAIHFPSKQNVTIYEYIKDSRPLDILAKLKEEIKIFQLLHHQSVLEIVEFMETKRAFYIVYEFILYQDLVVFVKANYFKLSIDSFRSYFIDACRAVEQLHRRGYLHGDLRTESFAISTHNKIKFKDLRSCREIICFGDRPDYVYEHVAKAKDIWSLGQLFKQMKEDIIVKNLSVEVDGKISKGLKSFPPELEDLLNHMLDPNPVSRITMTHIWLHPWLADTIRNIKSEEELEILNNPQSGSDHPRNDLIQIVANHYSVDKDIVVTAVSLKRLNKFYSYYLLLNNVGEDNLAQLINQLKMDDTSMQLDNASETDLIYLEQRSLEMTPATDAYSLVENNSPIQPSQSLHRTTSHKEIYKKSLLKLRNIKQRSIVTYSMDGEFETEEPPIKETSDHNIVPKKSKIKEETISHLTAQKFIQSDSQSIRILFKSKGSNLNNDLQIRKVKPFSAKRESDVRRSTSSCGIRPIYEWEF